MLITIRPATVDDAAFLAEFGARVFSETFAKDNQSEDMAAYLSSAFSPEKQRSEILQPGSQFLIAYSEDQPVGFARLQSGPAPTCITGSRPVELVRLYAIQAMIGRGVGGALMQHCLDVSRAGGYDVIWLGVWQKNPRAIAFYRKWGFEIAGTATFTIGSDDQTDWLMQRKLETPEGYSGSNAG